MLKRQKVASGIKELYNRYLLHLWTAGIIMIYLELAAWHTLQ